MEREKECNLYLVHLEGKVAYLYSKRDNKVYKCGIERMLRTKVGHGYISTFNGEEICTEGFKTIENVEIKGNMFNVQKGYLELLGVSEGDRSDIRVDMEGEEIEVHIGCELIRKYKNIELLNGRYKISDEGKEPVVEKSNLYVSRSEVILGCRVGYGIRSHKTPFHGNIIMVNSSISSEIKHISYAVGLESEEVQITNCDIYVDKVLGSAKRMILNKNCNTKCTRSMTGMAIETLEVYNNRSRVRMYDCSVGRISLTGSGRAFCVNNSRIGKIKLDHGGSGSVETCRIGEVELESIGDTEELRYNMINNIIVVNKTEYEKYKKGGRSQKIGNKVLMLTENRNEFEKISRRMESLNDSKNVPIYLMRSGR